MYIYVYTYITPVRSRAPTEEIPKGAACPSYSPARLAISSSSSSISPSATFCLVCVCVCTFPVSEVDPFVMLLLLLLLLVYKSCTVIWRAVVCNRVIGGRLEFVLCKFSPASDKYARIVYVGDILTGKYMYTYLYVSRIIWVSTNV